MIFITCVFIALGGGIICFVFDISNTWFNRLVWIAWFMLLPLFAVSDDSCEGNKPIKRLRKG